MPAASCSNSTTTGSAPSPMRARIACAMRLASRSSSPYVSVSAAVRMAIRPA